MSESSGVGVDLLVPVKTLTRAKSRLRGAADYGLGDPAAHARLALALARDTVAVAGGSRWVRRLVVISSDPEVTGALAVDGVEVIAEGVERGLNAALELGERVLRAGGGSTRALAVLQADLPALRAGELDAALERALASFAASRVERAFCADAEGVGTTLLVCAAGSTLRPRFGGRSAVAHADSGAVPITGGWPGLRRDVDTVEDLMAAAALGLGPATSAALSTVTPAPNPASDLICRRR